MARRLPFSRRRDADFDVPPAHDDDDARPLPEAAEAPTAQWSPEPLPLDPQAGRLDPVPAGLPADDALVLTPSFKDRGRLRRRLRYLRRVRELGFRDLGGLVFDLHRFEQPGEHLVEGKLDALGGVDRELRALERALDDRRDFMDLREPGIAACPRCAALHGSEARFCPNCGLRLGGPTALTTVTESAPDPAPAPSEPRPRAAAPMPAQRRVPELDRAAAAPAPIAEEPTTVGEAASEPVTSTGQPAGASLVRRLGLRKRGASDPAPDPTAEADAAAGAQTGVEATRAADAEGAPDPRDAADAERAAAEHAADAEPAADAGPATDVEHAADVGPATDAEPGPAGDPDAGRERAAQVERTAHAERAAAGEPGRAGDPGAEREPAAQADQDAEAEPAAEPGGAADAPDARPEPQAEHEPAPEAGDEAPTRVRPPADV